MTLAFALLAIIGSFAVGYWIYKTYGSGGADATYDLLAVLSASFWILAGIFAILGGFVAIGIVILIVFSYVWISKGKKTKKRLRSRLAG